MSLPRAGIVRIARPAMPAAATNVVANTPTDPVTNEAPAVAFGATKGVQASVPRSISVSDIHRAVKRSQSRFGRCDAHQMTAARQPVRVATALTAPIDAIANADRAARIRTEP